MEVRLTGSVDSLAKVMAVDFVLSFNVESSNIA